MTTYLISGMTCDGCTRSLKRAVEKSLGPDTATVQLHPGHLEVHIDHDPEIVRVAVERAGFTLERGTAGPAHPRLTGRSQ